MKKEYVVLVNEKDEELGIKEKDEAHLGEGFLHRAFAAFVFNDHNQLLIQKRGQEKMLWPDFWDNTCSSHPRKGEGYEEAGERRLNEELGFTCNLKNVDQFLYEEKYKDIGSEKELCIILVGRYNGKVDPNPEEVAEIKWADIDFLKKDFAFNPKSNIYTPWFKIAWSRIATNDYTNKVTNIEKILNSKS